MTVSAVRGRSKGRSRCCSHPRGPSIPAPGSSTTPARAVGLPSSRLLCLPRASAAQRVCLLSLCPTGRSLESPPPRLPYEPAPPSQPTTTVPTVWAASRLLSLWCPTSCASPLRVPHLRDSSAKRLLRRFNSHCYFSFLQLAAPYAEMPHTFLGVTVWSTVWTV